jgi:HAMP domain-containing protein
LGLAAWTRWPSIVLLVFAGVSALAVLAARPRAGRARALSSAIVLAGAMAGSTGYIALRRVSLDFDAYWGSRSARAEEALDERLQRLLEMGEDAVTRIGNLASGGTNTTVLAGLRDIRQETGMTLATIYGPEGGFRLWDGEHRGVVPDELRMGEVRYLYRDRPLFSYLYFTAPIQGGGTAMAAALIKANLPRNLEEDPGDFVTDFRDGVGEDLRIFRADRTSGEDVFDLSWDGQALFSVAVVRPTQEQRLSEVRSTWSRIVGLLAVIAWLVLAFTSGSEKSDREAGALTLLGLALLAPVGAAMGSAPFFTAADFVLPGPVPVTFERVLLLAAVLSVVVAAHMPPAIPLRSVASGLAVLIGFPLLSMLILGGAGPVLLAGEEGKWIVYQIGLALILTLVCLGSFRIGERTDGGVPPRIPLILAIVVLVALCLAGAFWVRMAGTIPGWVAGAWALPALLAAYGLSCLGGDRREWMAWFAAAAIGSSAAVVITWGARIDARMDEAELQLSRLGVPADPYLEYVLHRFADTADSLDAAGAESAELLYESWITSGLAEEGTGVWLTLWSAGDLPAFEITIGVEGGRPGPADDFLEEARLGEPALVRRLGLGDANYIVQVPLVGGRVVTGVLPARRELSNSSPFGPIFGGLTALSESPLTMVPVLEGDEATFSEETLWRRTGEGWEATMGVPYPDGAVDAKYALELPAPLLAVARGTLLVLANSLVILLLWTLGQYVLVGLRPTFRSWRNPFSSFRARVTLALFGFFLVSAALFGTVAFRTLNQATVRTAAAIAGRVAEDAAAFYRDVQGSMTLLSGRVGADLLEYRAGELRGGSVDDLVELGLYDGLIPFELNQRIESREELLETALGSLGRREYLMAFRRLPDGDVVATQVPLQAGATTLRQREIAELVGFVVLIGAGLSLVLAFLVARTLTSPIRTLQVASERVGGGDLDLQLPSDQADEFGSVFSAFNRMVLRLQRARRALVRTTRRTEAIVEDAATGVVALDAMGRVILVNARAQDVLEGRVEVGGPMPRFDGAIPRGHHG